MVRTFTPPCAIVSCLPCPRGSHSKLYTVIVRRLPSRSTSTRKVGHGHRDPDVFQTNLP
ncbi:hypothetical protein ARMSODRAFT_959118 [Armillaria solidipes]|uniref:Uncharacterized protein n=1 Tax=Armillaria solidipes TaxID=1076256 RepID=A0A2H3BUE4_9AGAR|nr:hypothetical protein ARMSODRAFT_959118 [Armillaria solidipes]